MALNYAVPPDLEGGLVYGGNIIVDRESEANNALHARSTISSYTVTRKALCEKIRILCSQSEVVVSSSPSLCLSFIFIFYWNQFLSLIGRLVYIHSDARQGVSFASRGPVEVGNQGEVEHRLRPRGQRTSRYDGNGSFDYGPKQLPRFGGRDRYSGDAIPFNFTSRSRSNSLFQTCSTIVPFCLFDFIIPFF